MQELAREPYTPPPWAVALIAAATLGFSGWFVVQGVEDARAGPARVSAELLSVEVRSKEAIPFTLETLDGKSVSLTSYPGKIVVLNFWATWCPPCVEEMPSMIKLFEELKKDPNIVVLAVSADESWEPVKKFFGQDPPGFTVLLDAKGQLAKQYGTTMFPETYVIKDGRILGFIEGPRRWDQWYAASYLRALAKERI